MDYRHNCGISGSFKNLSVDVRQTIPSTSRSWSASSSVWKNWNGISYRCLRQCRRRSIITADFAAAQKQNWKTPVPVWKVCSTEKVC